MLSSSQLAPLFDDHIRIQRQRTDAAIAACNFDTLAIHAGSPHMVFLDDQPYPFKPNPHFKLWVPLEDAIDCWLVYRPGEKPRLIFLQPADYWHKPPSLPHGFWTHHFQIEVIREPGDARRHLAAWAAALSSANGRSNSRTGASRRATRKRCCTGCTIREPSRPTTSWSACATRRTRPRAGTLRRKLRSARASRSTKFTWPTCARPDIRSASCRTRTSSRSTRNAAVLHYQHQEREAPAKHHSFLIDAGAQYHTYAADITRTYASSDGDFAALIAGMESLELQLCSQVRNGVDYANIHLDAHLRIAGLLHDSGVITMPAADAVTSGLSGCVLPARRRPPAGPAGARRRGLQRRSRRARRRRARRAILICGSRARWSRASS